MPGKDTQLRVLWPAEGRKHRLVQMQIGLEPPPFKRFRDEVWTSLEADPYLPDRHHPPARDAA